MFDKVYEAINLFFHTFLQNIRLLSMACTVYNLISGLLVYCTNIPVVCSFKLNVLNN